MNSVNLKLNRRNFLQVTAGGTLGVATSGITLRGLSVVNAALESEAVRVPTGPETFAPAICSLCPAGCGLRIRKIGDRAVHVQGNPLHPVNHGGICPKGAAALQELYHPDRLLAPRKNIGTRAKPRWKEVSWDEALAEITAQLGKLRAAGQARSLVLIDRPERNLANRMARQFMRAYGSPNYILLPSGLDSLKAAMYLQQGVTQSVAYDFDNTRYLLSFGVNLLEGWGSPVSIMRSFGRWRDSSSGRRTKFVQIEPRLSVTAAKADEWVPLRPGTEAALALGIAYVLISEGLYDAAFVRDRTFGFEDWMDAEGKQHLGLRSLVLREYRLNDVADITGVPPETILRLAREAGQNRPAVALGDHQTSTLPGNPYAAMAVHSLNALLGSLEAPGGVLLQQPSPLSEDENTEPAPRLDQSPHHPFPPHHLDHVPQAILSNKPYPVSALLLNGVDPVFSQPHGEAFRQAFDKVPFIVSFTSFANESSRLADFVLPASMALERWQDSSAPPTFPFALHSISPPVVASGHETRDPAEVLLALAKALGGQVAAALPFDSFEQYLRHHSDLLFAAQTGAVYATAREETWNRLLERSGWWAPSYGNADELWAQVKEHGGWWEPTYYYGEWKRVLQTPSGRFEFYSQTMKRWADVHPEFARAVGLPAGDDRLCLPHQPPITQPTPDFPLLLLPVEVLPLSGGEGAHLPYLQQIAGLHLFEHWESWVEIHPAIAREHGISDGDRIWVESPRGRVGARARLYAGVRPDVVHMPLGYGRTEGGAWASRGASPLALLETRFDPVAGLPQIFSTYVKVYRI